jgi:DDB1- and CUL4-associated factor 8
LIQHILVSENRQQSAEEGSSEDHENNTWLLDLVLRAEVEGVSSSSDDEDEDDDDDDEEAAASDGSE